MCVCCCAVDVCECCCDVGVCVCESVRLCSCAVQPHVWHSILRSGAMEHHIVAVRSWHAHARTRTHTHTPFSTCIKRHGIVFMRVYHIPVHAFPLGPTSLLRVSHCCSTAAGSECFYSSMMSLIDFTPRTKHTRKYAKECESDMEMNGGVVLKKTDGFATELLFLLSPSN